jgi:tRNA pseudouridine55 synthase
VRSLARDLGRMLGAGAHLTTLHRTAIGPWNDPGPGRSLDVHGRDLLPWAATRELSDQEVGDLRQERTIPVGGLIAPDWRVPNGFADPEAPVRGFHRGKLVFLLREEDARLRALTELPRGGL